MRRKQTTNRPTQLLTILALVTLLLLADVPLVHATGTWTNHPTFPSVQDSHSILSFCRGVAHRPPSKAATGIRIPSGEAEPNFW
jgi:hypothetical protein